MLKNDITGIVLSGGKSTRMGREKGLVNYGGKPLVSYSIQALESLCSNILLSANKNLDSYKKFGFRIVHDEVKGIGPLGGLLACLKQSDTQYNLVLSCDMPFVESALLEYLLSQVVNEQAVVPVQENGKLQPLCACYHTNIISAIEESIQKNNFKMIDFLNHINMKQVLINKQLPFFTEQLFFNINHPGQLS